LTGRDQLLQQKTAMGKGERVAMPLERGAQNVLFVNPYEPGVGRGRRSDTIRNSGKEAIIDHQQGMMKKGKKRVENRSRSLLENQALLFDAEGGKRRPLPKEMTCPRDRLER